MAQQTEGTTGSTGDADLDARLEQRLRSIEAKAGSPQRTAAAAPGAKKLNGLAAAFVPRGAGAGTKGAAPAGGAGGTVAAAGAGAGGDGGGAERGAEGPGEAEDAAAGGGEGDDDTSGPGSDDEQWLEDQLDEEEMPAAPQDPTEEDIRSFFADPASSTLLTEEAARSGIVVRGLCGVCNVEVLSDMPRFKIGDQYYHEACRDDAARMGVGCEFSNGSSGAQQQQQQQCGYGYAAPPGGGYMGGQGFNMGGGMGFDMSGGQGFDMGGGQGFNMGGVPPGGKGGFNFAAG